MKPSKRYGRIQAGTYIPYGTFSDKDDEVRIAYYFYGLRRDEDWRELPVLESEGYVEDPMEIIHKKRMTKEIYKLFEYLTPRQSKILILRFGIGTLRNYSLEETARIFNLSQERIRQIEIKALTVCKSIPDFIKLFEASKYPTESFYRGR